MDLTPQTPTWKHALHIWIAFVWRNLIFIVVSSLLGFVIGAAIGFVGALIGVPQTAVMIIIICITFPIGLAISIIPLKMILDKKEFGNFRLIIVPYDPSQDEQVTPILKTTQ